jgi:5'-nucleotidase
VKRNSQNKAVSHFVYIFQYEWVENHLGKDWINRLILTRDKTMINGDVLIDDKINITGIYNRKKGFVYNENERQSITSIRLYTPLRNPLCGLHGVYNLIEVISS